MNKVVPGLDLRERLRRQLEATRVENTGDVLQVLATKGNQDLLSLIGRHEPQSISELSELAGRKQPNVSRSLSALIGTGLVEIVSDGRRSIPTLTALGREKAEEYGLLVTPQGEGAAVPAQTQLMEPTLFALGDLAVAEGEGDEINGRLLTWLRVRGTGSRTTASYDDGLGDLALHLLENWWRILYRRDAPFKLFDLTLDESEKPFTLSVKSWGRHVELIARSHGGSALTLDDGFRRMPPDKFESSLLEELLRPVARYQRLSGYPDRPLQDRLSRLEDSRLNATEARFCKTAGALGLSPYGLDDEMYRQVRGLIDLISDEESRLDFASAVLGGDLAEGQKWVISEVADKGDRNRLLRLQELRRECVSVNEKAGTRPLRPWEKATHLARHVRRLLHIAPNARINGVNGLAELFGSEGQFQLSADAPGSVRAYQACKDDVPTIVIENEGKRSSFLLARAIGDYLSYGSRSACIADLYTDRQAIGRAFAAEFLAPAEGVIAMIEDEDVSPYRVAEHYGVSDTVIFNQYSNNA